MRQAATTLAAAATLVALALTGGAGAAEGDPYLKSCFATNGAPPCAALQPPFSAADAELSPDGRHLYAVVVPNGGGSNGIRLFDVAGAVLTPRDVFALPAAAEDVDLSPDGRHVYVGAGNDFLVYARDAASGGLSHVQTVTGLSAFSAAAVSPDGRSVYARSASQINVFDRDATSGTLAQKPLTAGCFVEEVVVATCSNAVGIVGGSTELAVSPDGRHLYVPNAAPGGVAVFNRQADGTLSQASGTSGGCVTVGGASGSAGGTECAAGAPTLSQARAVNVDPQGAFVIVSAAGGNTVFRRDAATGSLGQTDCLDEAGGGVPGGCHEAKGAAGGDAAIAPNGQDVVLNASEVGLSVFVLDRGSGRLAQRTTNGCFSATPNAPCQHAPGLLGGLGSATFASNGLSTFAAFRGGSVAGFELDVVPACADRTVAVPRNTPVFVQLQCSDANGDPVRLEIAAPPVNGSLGPVDQTRMRVLYDPDTNYRGRDAFRFRGLARGARGAVAAITINVLAKGKVIDRRAPNTRIRRGPPKTTRDRTAIFTFTATERGSRFECKLDKGRWSRCKSPKRYVGLKRGRHTFQVRAVDRAGNEDPTPSKRVWIRKR